MPTYFKASDKLIAAFNAANGTALTSSTVRFVDPRPAESIDASKAINYNTAVTMQLLEGAGRTGEVILFYNRVDLAKEFASYSSLQKDYITVLDAKDTRDVLPILNLKLGLRIAIDELVVHPITMKNDYFVVDIEALPNSMEYVGKIIVRLYNGTPAATATVLYDKASSVNTNRKNASGYTPLETDYAAVVAKTDYTPIANALMSIKAYGGYGAANVTELDGHMLNYSSVFDNILNSVDGISWVYDPAQQTTAPNTYRMNFLFNGPVDEYNAVGRDKWLACHSTLRTAHDAFVDSEIDYGTLADPQYDRVLVAAADWPWMSSKLYRALFFFHYNVRDDDEYILRYR